MSVAGFGVYGMPEAISEKVTKDGGTTVGNARFLSRTAVCN